MRTHLALAFLLSTALAEDGPAPLRAEAGNLDFESALESGWVQRLEGKVEFDESLRHAGRRSARISGPATRIPVDRALTQDFDATALRGKRVQLTGWVRWERSRIGLWILAGGVMDVDRESKRMPSPTEAADGWKRLAVRIEVPYDAEKVTIGARVYLEEGAPVWIDDLALEVCAEGVPLFDPTLVRANLANPGFEMKGADGAAPPEWEYETSYAGDPEDPCDNTSASEYEFVRDEESHVSGAACARLALLSGPRAGAVVRQKIGAAPWRGKRIRFSVYVREQKCKIPPEGPFLEVHSPEAGYLEADFDWGASKLSAWHLATLTIAVPEDADTITVGFRLDGGTLWLDAAELREAD